MGLSHIAPGGDGRPAAGDQGPWGDREWQAKCPARYGSSLTVLCRSGPSLIGGSINVKSKDGLYTAGGGFVVDLADNSFGRVPDRPELLSFRSDGFDAKERIRQVYFEKCLD